jgi:hypothetical protein
LSLKPDETQCRGPLDYADVQYKDFNAPATVFWQANATDARGWAIDEQLGSSLQRLRGFDPVSGRIEYIQTGPGGNAAVQNLVYQWDGLGNITTIIAVRGVCPF